MGYFIGDGDRQFYVDDNGVTWTNSAMTHKVEIIATEEGQIIDNEDKICNNIVAESFTDEQAPKKRGRPFRRRK